MRCGFGCTNEIAGKNTSNADFRDALSEPLRLRVAVSRQRCARQLEHTRRVIYGFGVADYKNGHVSANAF